MNSSSISALHLVDFLQFRNSAFFTDFIHAFLRLTAMEILQFIESFQNICLDLINRSPAISASVIFLFKSSSILIFLKPKGTFFKI